MKGPELLAPAKDLNTGITAINCGADAVYIGAPKFGARAGAGNTIEDIKKLINYAHKFWAKVYITINTILTDKEIIEARNLINELYESGADAIIIQDTGLLELDLPPIPLFASTQCHNNTWKKVDFLEKAGVQRVILARELSLDQIKEIKSKTIVELEFFVHGALCVSYSGQCYMSYAKGGRSANKGVCAQACRKSYTLTDTSGKVIAKNKHLLSLKDLNLSDHLDELMQAGVSSFKIEGRLKDDNYIKNIVSYYRKKIDKITGQVRNDNEDFDFNPDKTFNRGYTKYFITGRNTSIVCFDSPKHIGEPMGKIEKAKLNNGDGITYFDEKGNLRGTNEPKTIKKGTKIYRNFDHEYLKRLKSYKCQRKIAVDIELSNYGIELSDEQGNTINYEFNYPFEKATNREMALNNIKKQLSKLGETDFVSKKININLDPAPFIPVSSLNEIRRTAIEHLEKERAKNFPRKFYKIIPNDYPYPEKQVDCSANINNSYAKAFYERHGAQVIEMAAESGINLSGKKLMKTKHCLRHEFDLCKKSKEPLFLTDGINDYRLEFDCKNCEMIVIEA